MFISIKLLHCWLLMAALDDVTSAAPASATSSPQRPARKHVTVISAGSILGRSEDPEGEHVRLGCETYMGMDQYLLIPFLMG